jgi:hypothetical protein
MSKIVHLPRTTAQANRLRKIAKRTRPIPITITVLPDRDSFREQRAWRIMFGLYQDCTAVCQSGGFNKQPGLPFDGKISPGLLSAFLREAMPMVEANRVEVRVDGERLRRRLLDVMTA